MSIYIEIHGKKYPASITGRLHDDSWNNRASKAITLNMTYEEALEAFTHDAQWKILQCHEETSETLNLETQEIISTTTLVVDNEHDNSEYSIAGDIIDHRDGTVTVKMGQPTAEELLNMIMEELSL